MRQRVEDWDQFEYQLYLPTTGRVSSSDVEEELDQFSGFMSAFGGGG